MKKVIFGSWLQRFFSMVTLVLLFLWLCVVRQDGEREREGRGGEREGGKEKGTGMQLHSSSSWASSFFYLWSFQAHQILHSGHVFPPRLVSICQSSLEHPHRHAQHCPLPASWASLNPAKLIVLLYLNHHLAVSRPSHLMKELLLGIVIIWAPDSQIISTHICVLCFRPLPSILNSAIQPLPLYPW